MLKAVDEEQDSRQAARVSDGGPCREYDGAALPDFTDFEHLYTVYGPRVYYLCLRMTGNVDDAEDLSQEAFLRLIQKLDSFRGESAFYTWLRRLAINVVLLRYQTASWRREVSLEELTEPDSIFRCHPRREFACVDPEVAGAIDRIVLEGAVDRLAPGLKAVFILHDVEGYEHSEISRLMGCSIGTSKSQLHKARLRLREFLCETRQEKPSRSSPGNNLKSQQNPTPLPRNETPVLHFPRPLPHEYQPPVSRTA